MNQIFNVASLVIGVSGATYMALLAMRDLLGAKVTQRMNVATDHMKEIEGSRNNVTKRNGKRQHDRVIRWHGIWSSAFAVPVVLFLFFSFYLTCDVCFDCWDNPEIATPCWHQYKYLLAGLVILNAICLSGAFLAYNRIRSNGSELKGYYDSKLAEDALLSSSETQAR